MVNDGIVRVDLKADLGLARLPGSANAVDEIDKERWILGVARASLSVAYDDKPL